MRRLGIAMALIVVCTFGHLQIAGAQSCVGRLDGAACTHVVPGSTVTGSGEIVSIEVQCVEGEQCLVSQCETIIADDSIYPDGVVWDGTDGTIPVTAAPDTGITVTDNVEDPATPEGSEWGTEMIIGSPYGEWDGGHWSESGSWVMCRDVDQETGEEFNGQFGPGGPLIDVDGLLAQAIAQATPPDPPINRAPGNSSVAQMPTWFWLSPGYWRDYVGTGSSPTGRMIVEATSTPDSVTWVTPEETLECDEGTPWTDGLDPRADSECFTIFEHAYSYYGGPVSVQATATFNGTWRMIFDNGVAYDQGTYGPLEPTDSFDIEIMEIQALVAHSD